MRDQFALNAYQSLMNTKGKWWVLGDEKMFQLMNFIVNIGMVLNKWLYQIVDKGLELFMTNTVFEDTIGAVFKVAISLYDSLYSNLGITLFIVAVTSIFFVFAFKSPQQAIRQGVMLVLVLGINFGIYTKGEEYIKTVNTVFDEVETVMVNAVTVPMFNNDGSQTNVNVGEQNSVDSIRETYFRLSMEQPFAMVNFGEAQFTEDMQDFLYTEENALGDNAKEERDRIEDLIKEKSKENVYLTPDSIGDKLFLSLYAMVSNVFVGIPLLFLAVFKFVLKLLILAMVFVLPIISIISIIPRFSNSLTSGLGKLLSVFFAGTFMSFAMFLFFFIMTLIDSSIIAMQGGANILTALLGTVVKIVVVLLIVKFRNQIVSFVTGGHISHVPTMGSEMRKELRRSSRRHNKNEKEENNTNDDQPDESKADDEHSVEPVTAEEVRVAVEDAFDARNMGEVDESDESEEEEQLDVEAEGLEDIEGVDVEAEGLEDIEGVDVEAEGLEDIEGVDVEAEGLEDIEGVDVEVEGLEDVEVLDVEAEGLEDIEPLDVEAEGLEEIESLDVEAEGLEEIEPLDVEAEGLEEIEPLDVEAEGLEEIGPLDVEAEGLEDIEPLDVETEAVEGYDSVGIDVDNQSDGVELSQESTEAELADTTNQLGENIQQIMQEQTQHNQVESNGSVSTIISEQELSNEQLPEHEKFMQRLEALREQD